MRWVRPSISIQLYMFWRQLELSESESRSVMCDSLRPHGLYSSWNSPGQNPGVGSHSLLQGIFQPRDQTQVSHIAGRFLSSWATRDVLIPKNGDPDFSIWVVFMEDIWLNKLGRMLMWINPVLCPNVWAACSTKFWPGIRMPCVGLVELWLLSLYPRWLFPVCFWVAVSLAFWWHGYPE